MELLSVKINLQTIEVGSERLADTMREFIYQNEPDFFDFLEFSDDKTFLEPALFYSAFSRDKSELRTPMGQLLFGYSKAEYLPYELLARSDSFGIINLPGKGYIKDNSAFHFVNLSQTILSKNLVTSTFLLGSGIRLCVHGTDMIDLSQNIILRESPEKSAINNNHNLIEAKRFIRENTADLWDLIKLVTREIVLFNSPNQNSFAAIAHHGTAYINTEDKIQTVPFFVDEIAHQCGHIIFNVLTLDSARFLRVPKETPLRKFVRNFGESRTVYGAFHGLFTYTTILYALSRFVDNSEKYTEMDHYEALGRIGFYIDKFREDLKLMERASVLTDEGMFYHEQFRSGFLAVSETFGARIANFRYYNQPYTFQLDRFLKANPMHGRSRLFGLF